MAINNTRKWHQSQDRDPVREEQNDALHDRRPSPRAATPPPEAPQSKSNGPPLQEVKVNQDMAEVTPEDFIPIPTVTVVFATPPCQPFSKAGSTPALHLDESKPFVACVNLIKALNNAQGPKTYFIDNVPNSAKLIEITDALGPAHIVEAHKLGS